MADEAAEDDSVDFLVTDSLGLPASARPSLGSALANPRDAVAVGYLTYGLALSAANVLGQCCFLILLLLMPAPHGWRVHSSLGAEHGLRSARVSLALRACWAGGGIKVSVFVVSRSVPPGLFGADVYGPLIALGVGGGALSALASAAQLALGYNLRRAGRPGIADDTLVTAFGGA